MTKGARISHFRLYLKTQRSRCEVEVGKLVVSSHGDAHQEVLAGVHMNDSTKEAEASLAAGLAGDEDCTYVRTHASTVEYRTI